MLFATRVTEDDLILMTKLAKAHFDSVIVILKQLPRSMLLVFRYNQPKITIHKLLRSVTYSYSRQKLSFLHVSFASLLRPRERERERESTQGTRLGYCVHGVPAFIIFPNLLSSNYIIQRFAGPAYEKRIT